MPKSKTLPNALMTYRISTSKTKVWDFQYASYIHLTWQWPHHINLHLYGLTPMKIISPFAPKNSNMKP